MSMVFDPGDGNMLVVDGNLVERDALHIAEKINDYDDRLFLICLDPEHPDVQVTDAPFVIIRQKDNGTYERVLEAWELDDRIMERLWLSDNRKNDQIEILAKMELAKKKENQEAWDAKQRENASIFLAAMKNTSSKFTLKNKEGEIVTIHDNHPTTRDRGKKSFS